MVETGHGTGDNFTGQVMEKKKQAAKFTRTLLSGGSFSIYSFACLLTYLFMAHLMTLSLSHGLFS